MQKFSPSLLVAALAITTASVIIGSYIYSWMNKPKILPPPTGKL